MKRENKINAMREAHTRLMADLYEAMNTSLGETRTLLRRAIVRLETLAKIADRKDAAGDDYQQKGS